ncbi:MAG: glycosyltransferase family 2 protein [Pseudomonadota bacterium]
MAKDTTLLVATVKNEGPNILEWVAHHRLCGFDRIQIYQNDSTDTTTQTLRILDRIGVIEFNNNRHNKGAHQMRAYRRAARSEAFRDSTWCMTLDGDEFLNVKTGDRSVHALLATGARNATTMLVPWRVFGSNGKHALSGELVTEKFTQAEPAANIRTSWTPFKSIFRTDAYRRPGIHLPRDPLHGDRLICNASGLTEKEFDRKNWRAMDPCARKFAQVNHYMVRDLPSFLLKHARGSANAPHRDVGLSYWKKHDRNEEEDTTLSMHAFELWAEMRRLDKMADGKLLPLRARGVRQWRLALDDLMKDNNMVALRDAIIGQSGVANPNPDFGLPMPTPVFSSVRRAEPPEATKAVKKG